MLQVTTKVYIWLLLGTFYTECKTIMDIFYERYLLSNYTMVFIAGKLIFAKIELNFDDQS